MTNRERVIMAVNHRETDFVPYEIGYTQQCRERLMEHVGGQDNMPRVNHHIRSAYYDGWPRAIAGRPGFFIDDFGVVWNRTGADRDIGVIEGFRLPEPVMTISLPPVPEAALRESYAKLERESELFRFASIGFSVFERAWTLRGMENLLTDMVENPDFVHELMELICAFNLRVIDIALEYDIDGFHFGDDWGQQRGLIMGPKHWRTFIKPYVERMYARVKQKGLIVSQHSCGDIHEILPELSDIGLDIYQTFQPEIYDIEAVKAGVGQRMTFWGGISTQQLLPYATPDETRAEVVRLLKILGKGGGYIAAPTHAIPGDVPPENIIAMIDVLSNQAKHL